MPRYSLLTLAAGAYAVVRRAAAAPGMLTGALACYGVYRCADGRYLSSGGWSRSSSQRMVALMGVEHLAALQYDPARQDELRLALAARFVSRSRAEWLALLADEDTCVAPVNDVAEAFADADAVGRGLVVTARLADGTPRPGGARRALAAGRVAGRRRRRALARGGLRRRAGRGGGRSGADRCAAVARGGGVTAGDDPAVDGAGVLPEPVRNRVVALAADAIGSMDPEEIPGTLRRAARFRAANRSRLAAVATPLAVSLTTDDGFRRRVAARVRTASPELCAALDDGVAPPRWTPSSSPPTRSSSGSTAGRGWRPPRSRRRPGGRRAGEPPGRREGPPRRELAAARTEVARLGEELAAAPAATAAAEAAEVRAVLRRAQGQVRAAESAADEARAAADAATRTPTPPSRRRRRRSSG